MKIGELVWRLNEIKTVHGDLAVTTEEWNDIIPNVEQVGFDGEFVVAINTDWDRIDGEEIV